jgi:predicted RNA-binding Zn ribbon-like protein
MTSPAMEPLFVGSHPAMDFLNTTLSPRGEAIELIGDGASFVAWLVSAGLLDATGASRLKRRLGVDALDAAAAEARKLREGAAQWIARWREAPGADYTAEIRRLNGLLQRQECHRELVAAKKGMQLIERCGVESAEELIPLVAKQIALLVATEQPALVKRCAGAECTLWFLDRTKAHSRLFCSASACGNRAKVAAFRERQRAG